MGRSFWAIAVVAAVVGAGPTLAQTKSDGGGASSSASARHGALPMEGVITDPDWVSRPSAEDMGRFYPTIAQFMGLGGRVMMSCAISALGTLENCRIVSEAPSGMGFGAAALSMAANFHMRPRSIDGSNVGGAQVNIPINFALPPSEAAQAASAMRPVSPTALALARRLVAADGDEQGTKLAIEYATQQLVTRLRQDASAGGDTPEAQAALAAIQQAFEDALPAIFEREATAAANTLSNADLAAAIAFLESPAGKAWVSQRLHRAAERQMEAMATTEAVQAAAKKSFCLKVACLPSAGAQPGGSAPGSSATASAPRDAQ